MKIMKLISAGWTWGVLVTGLVARGGIEYSDGSDVVIPQGNPVGISSTATVSGYEPVITSVSVSLDISGGNNGNLYAYLSYDGQLVTLLDLPGVTGSNPVGYTDAGMNVTLADGNANINTYGSGSYSVNGNGQVTGTYSAAGGSLAFGDAYNSLNPNGTWTLFIADLSGGGPSSSELVTWSLNVTAVPEPVALALALFGGLAGLWWCLGVCWKRNVAKAAESEEREFDRK